MSNLVRIERSCRRAAQHAGDGIAVPGRRLEHAALDAVETTDLQQEVVEVLAPAHELLVKISVAGDPLSDGFVVEEMATGRDCAIIGAVEGLPAGVWTRAGEETGFVLATVPDREVGIDRASRIGQRR